ncbi:hypothetical protein [Cellvibrio sp. pealriver]|uniref:hypothetical protein n=1 Tax=Cellvibrio sp. pealriver TaxID=1622269 RepID=UPI00066FE79B|nr:hypothetical protein [Cellvibrio sp. pealriver]
MLHVGKKQSAYGELIRWQRFILCVMGLCLIACGGGGGGSSNPVPVNSKTSSSPQSSMAGSSLSSSSLSAFVTINGRITYDRVPHNTNRIGLNYPAVEIKPGRGLLVELLDENNQTLLSSTTNSDGFYSFNVERDKPVKVRAKAQLRNSQSPAWDFKVTDNTNNNALYAMDGNLVAATDNTAVRNLHAPSGWTGAAYTQPRVAAPFAIADSVYIAIERVMAAGNTHNFPSLELRWSPNNKTAEGDVLLGEIGTSYFNGDAIYILGDENNDTDEYDSHVILHEWGHYFEAAFSRTDSIGGDHAYGDKMDMRVAMSEGFSNAFSAMMLDDPDYRDASGTLQSSGFSSDVSRKVHSVRGWYSEASVQSILYNFYTSGVGKTMRDFSDIFNIMTSSGYSQSSALTSIYVFADELRNLLPSQTTTLNNLLSEQNIALTDTFGVGESNSGGYAGSLPVYKIIQPDNTPINVCSTNRFGAYNKLATAQFFVVNIASAGTYEFSAQEADESGDSDPDLYLYSNGFLRAIAEGAEIDQERLSRFLSAGTYVLELVDARVMTDENLHDITACFNVQMQLSN